MKMRIWTRLRKSGHKVCLKPAEGFRLSDRENERYQKKWGLPTVGLEPTIFRLGGGRLIH